MQNMELYTQLPPDEAIRRAEGYMLSRGASIKESGEASVTFVRRPPVGCGEQVLIAITVLLTFGVALLYVAFRVWWVDETRLMTSAAQGGRTRLLIDGKGATLRGELEEWAQANLAT